jgi:hypothetical protein
MKIIAEIQGWQKTITIDELSFRKGTFLLSILPTLPFLVPESKNIPKKFATKEIRLFYYGKNKNDLPLFTDNP